MPITVGLVGAGVGAIGTGINLYNSYDQRKRAQNQLNKLQNTPIEQYAAAPELRSFYGTALNDAQNPMGYSAAQRSKYFGDINNRINTVQSNAIRQSGGNLSRYLSNALNAGTVGDINSFYAQDAGLRMNNRNNALNRQYGAIGQFQNINNMNVAAKNRRQELIAQALGGSIAQQNQNIAGAYNNFANAGYTAAGYALGGGVPKGSQKSTSYKGSGVDQYGNYDPNYLPPELLN
jgi:hypothetical protein